MSTFWHISAPPILNLDWGDRVGGGGWSSINENEGTALT